MTRLPVLPLLALMLQGHVAAQANPAASPRVNPRDGSLYVQIPAGTFEMGCQAGPRFNPCTYGWALPAHRVNLAAFVMGQTPVTQAAFERVMGATPSQFVEALLPVENASWHDAEAYCEAVGLQLPTEEQWEFAERGASDATPYAAMSQIAWYGANSGKTTHPVAQKLPNAYGLFDMLGDVAEWVRDWEGGAGPPRILRGLAWNSPWSPNALDVTHDAVVWQRLPVPGDGFGGFRCAGAALPAGAPPAARELLASSQAAAQAGRSREAQRLARRAIAWNDVAPSPDRALRVRALTELGILERLSQDLTGAERNLALALQNKDALGADRSGLDTLLFSAAHAYVIDDKNSLAEPLLRQLLQDYELDLSANDPRLYTVLVDLWRVCKGEGKDAEATTYFTRSQQIKLPQPGPAPTAEDAVATDRVAARGEPASPATIIAQLRLGDPQSIQTATAACAQLLAGGTATVSDADYIADFAIMHGQDRTRNAVADPIPLLRVALALQRQTHSANAKYTLATLVASLARQGDFAAAAAAMPASLPDQERQAAASGLAIEIGFDASTAEMHNQYPAAAAMLASETPVLESVGGSALAEAYRDQASLLAFQNSWTQSLALYRQAFELDQAQAGGFNAAAQGDLSGAANAENHIVSSLTDPMAKADASARAAEANLQAAIVEDHILAGQIEYPDPNQLWTVQNAGPVLDDSFRLYLSALSRYPQAAAALYDQALLFKGVLADHAASLYGKADKDPNSPAAQVLRQIADQQKRLAQLAVDSFAPDASPAAGADKSEKIARAQQTIASLQGNLVRLQGAPDPATVTWEQVRAHLHPGEASVEFVYRAGRYVAIVLTPAMTRAPAVIDLGAAAGLEADPLTAYRRLVQPPPEAAATLGLCAAPATQPAGSVDTLALYRAFWQPLLPALGAANRIYVAPDGALDQIALGVMSTPDGHLLMEKYDLRLLNSTADLLNATLTHPTAAKTAVLFANPQFDLRPAQYLQAIAGLSPTRTAAVPAAAELPAALQSKTLSGCAPLADLHGLQVGVEQQIAPLMERNSLRVTTYVKERALTEELERIQAPLILHIATHGLFVPVEQPPPAGLVAGPAPVSEDAMLHSMLFFAGANATLAGNPPQPGVGSGVFTALQASTLNLHGTELVTLSACDTGLGQFNEGEGVFGLRRALQEAGAHYVLMTLWEVPSIQTTQLMTAFYTHWLSGGMEIHDALRTAQLELRRANPSPFYWGGFVLIGN